MTDKLNIVLVHGAFGDGSHWRHIIPRLYQAGHRVMAVQNPLTSLADDVANTRKLAEWMGGPTLLVGHSYGGAVITGAGQATNVVGLVYQPRLFGHPAGRGTRTDHQRRAQSRSIVMR